LAFRFLDSPSSSSAGPCELSFADLNLSRTGLSISIAVFDIQDVDWTQREKWPDAQGPEEALRRLRRC
jgi:hypothetical protein